MSCDEIPPAAELVRDFVNTYEVDQDADHLADLPSLRRWLSDRGLVSPIAKGAAADVQAARHLRESFRAQLARDSNPAPLPEVALRPVWGEGGARLAPADGGLRAGVAELAIAAVHCSMDGSWSRLKVCASETCRWAFYDTTRNRSRSWCSMDVCGNREKTKAYRARHR
ncbi:MAG TPA: CGNR zinc finger domain-containing protein [Mycobacteriales bacterium]|nr:CGNR zinc finger domain-containing protein [Mycobacteriales bacterium]